MMKKIVLVLVAMLILASCGITTQKVACVMCNGTGRVKYYYGEGGNEYSMGPCTSCNEIGYITVHPKGNSKGGTRVICGSCETYVDELITREDVAGEVRTWCADCWVEYDDIVGR